MKTVLPNIHQHSDQPDAIHCTKLALMLITLLWTSSIYLQVISECLFLVTRNFTLYPDKTIFAFSVSFEHLQTVAYFSFQLQKQTCEFSVVILTVKGCYIKNKYLSEGYRILRFHVTGVIYFCYVLVALYQLCVESDYI